MWYLKKNILQLTREEVLTASEVLGSGEARYDFEMIFSKKKILFATPFQF